MSLATAKCPFCDPEQHRVVFTTSGGLVLRDGYPLTDGHTLVVPRVHVQSLFELDDVTQAALWNLVAEVRLRLKTDWGVDAFNIGINDGIAAGQTISHAHIHVVPRRTGDVKDPRGGLRWIIPERAKYW